MADNKIYVKVAAAAGYTKDAEGNLTFSGEGHLGPEEDGERPSSALSGDSAPRQRERPAQVSGERGEPHYH